MCIVTCQQIDAAANPELLASFRQQPAEFNLWCVIEFIKFFAALITEEFQLIVLNPIPEDKGAYTRCPVAGNSCQLEPA